VKNNNKQLTKPQSEELISILKSRFEKNKNRHQDFDWNTIQAKLEKHPDKLWSLNEMEKTGGEPNVLFYEKNNDKYVFYDCSVESPIGRRSVCYDKEGQESRKEHKPQNNAIEMANSMGIEILNEEQYFFLQTFGNFDKKTSSWLKTPNEIRKLGGAIFADYRYGKVFVYHNGAQSYYGVRGFRGLLKV
jgi:hypothetical protein